MKTKNAFSRKMGASVCLLGTSIASYLGTNCGWTPAALAQATTPPVNQSPTTSTTSDRINANGSVTSQPTDANPTNPPQVLSPVTINASSQPPISTKARDLLPNTPTAQIDAQTSLLSTLLSQNTVSENNQEFSTDDKKQKPFSFYFGSDLPDPTALSGPTRSPIVPASERIRGGASANAGIKISPSKPFKIFLEGKGGESVLGGDVSVFYGSDDLRNGFAVNVFGQQAYSPSFYKGETDVRLPNGDKPWVERLGGGVEYRRGLTQHLQSTVGVTYQSITVRDGLFGSQRQPIDQFGNPLTVSNSGRDDLLTLNLGLEFDNRDNPKNALQGTHLRFGLDQSIPSGSASIGMTRLSGSASQFFKLPFFSSKNSTFVLNVQGGHILGDAPPYEAFSLGGDDTVRGYQTAQVGTGRSFFEASAEYRFPLFDIKVFKQPIGVGGVLFADYGSLLGTQDDVIGQPGVVRNKPGDGFGYGIGVRLSTGFGIIRLEAGFNDRGDVEPHIAVGERF